MYWRDRLGFPDLKPQLKFPGAGKPEVDPVSQKQFDVLVDTLLSRAATQNQLDKLVSLLRQNVAPCPTPPQIHEFANVLDAENEGAVKEWSGEVRKCPKDICDGSGFVVDRSGAVGNATYCECHAAYRTPKPKGATTTHAATAAE